MLNITGIKRRGRILGVQACKGGFILFHACNLTRISLVEIPWMVCLGKRDQCKGAHERRIYRKQRAIFLFPHQGPHPWPPLRPPSDYNPHESQSVPVTDSSRHHLCAVGPGGRRKTRLVGSSQTSR